jgi:hypothetical protein
MLLMGKPSISMGHLYHGYVTNNQRVNSGKSWVEHAGTRGIFPRFCIFPTINTTLTRHQTIIKQ